MRLQLLSGPLVSEAPPGPFALFVHKVVIYFKLETGSHDLMKDFGLLSSGKFRLRAVE